MARDIKPRFAVIDTRNGHTVGRYASIETARRWRDRFDMKYGACIHRVVEL